MSEHEIITGDCVEIMAGMDAGSIDAIVCDPPYGLGFMGKDWDRLDIGKITHANKAANAAASMQSWHLAWAIEALRVLKPGGHLLAFGGTRTSHRLTCAIEDAGFEIRDSIAWIYGSGFPKSHNVANAIDKANGHGNRGHAIASGCKFHPTTGKARAPGDNLPKYEARSKAGEPWSGWGTALKPAIEPITVARKPLDGTVAHNVTTHGVGGLNIDGCRVACSDNPTAVRRSYGFAANPETAAQSEARGKIRDRSDPAARAKPNPSDGIGRWPANLIHDGSPEVVAGFPYTPAGFQPARRGVDSDGRHVYGDFAGHDVVDGGWRTDSGSAARFFYVAKASQAERGDGNTHPTQKPETLMRYLCRLVAPAGALVLDPFAGSGTTGVACVHEGFRFVGIEREPEYVEIARRRIADAKTQGQFSFEGVPA